jgi:Protein of unknown function (DUF4238)
MLRVVIGQRLGSQAVTHKRQHYIPRSYLRGWCDPDCPPGQTPYVWTFSKGGGQVRRKSSEKIFRETDMYTVRTADGQRDLTLETNLARLESEFAKLRREKLSRHLPLSPEERLYLCMFVATMHGRTKAYAEHLSGTWNKALEMGEKVQQAMLRASDEQRASLARALSSPESGQSPGFTMDEVCKFVEQPLQEWLPGFVTGEAPLLFERQFMILETSVAPGFITSDAPCVWFDPADYQRPRPRSAGGLASPTIEITLPLSPIQMLMIGNRVAWPQAYVPVPDQALSNLFNKRTRIQADEYFVANRPKPLAAWL